MPTNFDYNAAPTGVKAGRELPNRNTGLAEVVASITADAKKEAERRREDQTKFYERYDEYRKQNSGLAKSLLDQKYKLKEGADMESFLNSGDMSAWEAPPSEFEQLNQVMGLMKGQGNGGGSALPPGTTMKVGGFNIPLNPAYSPAEINQANLASQMSSDVAELKSMLQTKDRGIKRAALVPFGQMGNIDAQKYALVYQRIANTLLYLRSGAQINEQEYQRLKAMLPAASRENTVDTANLDKFSTEFNNILARQTMGKTGFANYQQSGGASGMLGGSGGGQITVVSPNGELGTIPAEDLQQALAEGYTLQQ